MYRTFSYALRVIRVHCFERVTCKTAIHRARGVRVSDNNSSVTESNTLHRSLNGVKSCVYDLLPVTRTYFTNSDGVDLGRTPSDLHEAQWERAGVPATFFSSFSVTRTVSEFLISFSCRSFQVHPLTFFRLERLVSTREMMCNWHFERVTCKTRIPRARGVRS